MAVTYDGALYFGPDVDATRYYSGAMPNTPTGDFAIFMILKVRHAYLGDPTATQALVKRFAQNSATVNFAGTGGGDCYLSMNAINGPSSPGKIAARIGSGGINLLGSGTSLTSTSTFKNGDTVLVVLQSNGGTVQLKTCLAGGAVVSEASAARNASFTAKSLGTWYYGLSNIADQIQCVGMAAQAFSDTDIANIAAGADLESIVSVSGNRLALWLFNTTGASIPATWGATALTRSGTWTNQPVSSPVIPSSGAAAIALSNQPVPYGAVAINDDGTAPTYTWTGTYSGFVPATFQGRIENLDGSTVVDWTNLSSFAAAGGAWSGAMTVPLGGLYRIQIRDSVNAAIFRGGMPWMCCGVISTIGQSPHVLFTNAYSGSVAVSGSHYLCSLGINQIVPVTTLNVGSGLATALSAYTAASGKGLLVLTNAVTGTNSSQWASRDALVWPGLLAALDYVKPKRLLFNWLNGAAESSLTAVQIKANHDSIISNLDADATTTRGISYRYKMLPHNRDTGNTSSNYRTRTAQYTWARDHAQAGTKVLLGPWWGDMQTNAEVVGTAQAGAASTVTLAANDPSGDNTTYAGGTITITSGTGAGQTRTISSYVFSTKVLTVSAAWTTVPDATSQYKILNTSPHPADSGGTRRFGTRYGIGLAYSFGYSTVGGRGPVVSTATYPNGGNGTILDVTVTHRHGSNLRTPNGGTSATGLAAWQVSEDGFTTTKTITSATITGSNTVRLVLSAAPANKANLLIRYGAAEPVAPASYDAVGGGLGDLLYDDSGVAPTSGLPLYFTSADIAPTEAPVAGGALLDAGFFAST